MQNQLSERNRTALADRGARAILSELVNVPDFSCEDWPLKAQEFVDRNGKLVPQLSGGPLDGSDVVEYARRFRTAWDAKRDPELVPSVNSYLDEIFAPTGTQLTKPYRGYPAVFSADFYTGRWTPRPRTLLDVLAIELMRSRKALHRCENPSCAKYFIKRYSREKYHHMICGEQGRIDSLKRYDDKRRQERNRRRRKTKTVRRLKKGE